MRSLTVHNLSNKEAIPLHLSICDDFLSRLRGLMFSNDIASDGGLFFLNPTEDRINSAIHMYFMKYDLAIIWTDSSGCVVDKIYAHRWKTLAAPKNNAKFILETHIDRIEEYNCGDVLDFIYE